MFGSLPSSVLWRRGGGEGGGERGRGKRREEREGRMGRRVSVVDGERRGKGYKRKTGSKREVSKVEREKGE